MVANIDVKDKNGYTPLYAAVRDNEKELVKLGADINTKLDNSRDPLYTAIIYHNINIIKELLKLGARIGDYHLKLANKSGQDQVYDILQEKLNYSQ